tara:strand:+ start:1602 stop:1952 length:351 start_codon:yes stop_codon:yes gene_type:complete
MSAFVITPIKRIRSCPVLYMSEPISPNTVKKEIIVGTAMAFASILVTGQHHHLTSFKELESTMSYETINILSELQYNKKSLFNRMIRLRKNKALLIILLTPFVVRMLAFIGIEFIF